MRARNTATGWGWVSRLLHWLTAALIVLQLGIALYIGSIDDLARRFEAAQTHKSWGTVIFVVALGRIAWRLAGGPAPALPASTKAWQRRLAHVSHMALYGLLLAVPVLGWVYASASPLQALMEIENRVFGVLALPDPWPVGHEATSDAAYVLHRAGAIALVGLVAVHAAAGLKHHFVDRDDVLVRMIRPR